MGLRSRICWAMAILHSPRSHRRCQLYGGCGLSSIKAKVGPTTAAYTTMVSRTSSRYWTAVTKPRVKDVQVGAVS
ncbi:hypothetical protein TNCV_483881 [Trichonephila clavipes]|nr:hypothetical protein TNCV_483881 [Trichonephila clavipes]